MVRNRGPFHAARGFSGGGVARHFWHTDGYVLQRTRGAHILATSMKHPAVHGALDGGDGESPVPGGTGLFSLRITPSSAPRPLLLRHEWRVGTIGELL